MMLRTLVAALVLNAVAWAADPAVPGFSVTLHGTVSTPAAIAFAPNGDLYVGNSASGGPVRRVQPSGVVEDYGPVIVDADAVFFDAAGVVGSQPGSVLVGSAGKILEILPNQTTALVCATNLSNVNDLQLSLAGELFVADLTDTLKRGDACPVLNLVTAGAPVSRLALDHGNGLIYTLGGGVSGTVSVYRFNGDLLDAALTTVGQSGSGMAFGSLGSTLVNQLFAYSVGGDLLAIDAAGTQTILGTGFDQGDLAFGPDGALYASQASSGNIFRIAPVGQWLDQGCALTGVSGDPALVGTGTLVPTSANGVDLSNAAANALAGLFVALSSAPVPFKGGTLKPFPHLPPAFLTTSASGEISVPFVMPVGVPAGTELWVQWAIQDGAASHGVALSNALLGVTP